MRIINPFRDFIESLKIGIPYRIRREWYNKNIFRKGDSMYIHTFKEDGMYIPPQVGGIVTVVFTEPRRKVYARYTITKMKESKNLVKKIYSYDNIIVNLKFHSLIYTI